MVKTEGHYIVRAAISLTCRAPTQARYSTLTHSHTTRSDSTCPTVQSAEAAKADHSWRAPLRVALGGCDIAQDMSLTCAHQRTCYLQEDDEGLISVGGGSSGAVAAAAPAPVAAPAAAVDEGSSLLSQDEQQEAFFADPTANGAAPGTLQFPEMASSGVCCQSILPLDWKSLYMMLLWH